MWAHMYVLYVHIYVRMYVQYILTCCMYVCTYVHTYALVVCCVGVIKGCTVHTLVM